MFVLSAVFFAFANVVNETKLDCLTKWTVELADLQKVFVVYTQPRLANLTGTDEDAAEQVITETLANIGNCLSVSWKMSDAVLCVAIVYAFLIFLNSIFTLGTLCLSSRWRATKCISYQPAIHAVSSLLAICLCVITAVFCHFMGEIRVCLQFLHYQETHGANTAAAPANCMARTFDLHGKWSPVIILMTMVLIAIHLYVVKISRSFNQSISFDGMKASLNVDAPDHPQKTSDFNKENKVRGLLSVKNLADASALARRDAQRNRIPSSRNYPSSPILP